MLVLLQPDFVAMSRVAAGILTRAIRKKPDSVLGLATGSTPKGVYRELVREFEKGEVDFSSVTTFNLDEYLGLPAGDPRSYRFFMWEELFRHVNVPEERIHIPDGSVTKDLYRRCDEYEQAIRRAGGIDIQLLGIGKEGHIGFNEPTSSLGSRTRVKTLTAETREANRRFFSAEENLPECVITMGIGTILEARRILLIASGIEKAEAIERAVEGPVSSSCSASALQLHGSVTVIVDEAAASRLKQVDYYRRVMETTERLTPERLL